MLQRFQDFFEKYQAGRSKFLVAISGGMDSVVLARLCKSSGFDFALVHCNFNLREEESLRDENFVRSLAKEWGVKLFVEKFETGIFAKEERISIQEAARKLRYRYFEEIISDHHFNYCLLAHHADDNIETVAMHFFRGTGIKGLTGIPEFVKEKKLLRPLLQFRRSEIEDFALINQLTWVEDSSNASQKYTRNFFRLEVLPLVKTSYAKADENLLENIKRFKGIYKIYDDAIHKLKNKIITCQNEEVRIPVLKLLQYKQTSLLFEIIKEYGFTEKQEDEIWKLTESVSGKFIENQKFQVIRHNKWLIIAPKKEGATIHVIDETGNQLHYAAGKISIAKLDIADLRMDPSPDVALIDARHISFPLVLRKWKQGDYFYPLGMRKKKKIARFLVDSRIPKNQKENTWVLESDKKIIWIVGHRIDDRVKINDATKKLFKFTFERKNGSH